MDSINALMDAAKIAIETKDKMVNEIKNETMRRIEYHKDEIQDIYIVVKKYNGDADMYWLKPDEEENVMNTLRKLYDIVCEIWSEDKKAEGQHIEMRGENND